MQHAYLTSSPLSNTLSSTQPAAPHRPSQRWIAWLKVLALLLFIGGVLRWFERQQVYHPSRRLAATGQELGRPFEDVELQASDGVRLHAWFFPADPSSPRRHQVWLLLHGNAGNISHRLSHADLLLQTGCNALLLDYRGYGRSSGRPSETGTYLDAEAAHDWLQNRGFSSTHIFALGESLGGGVASELALRRTLGGLVLLSSFTSVPDLGSELFPWLPVRWLVSFHYDTHAKLPRITVPVLICHGRSDSLVGFQHAERNLAAAHHPKRLVALAGDHNDVPGSDPLTYRLALEDLVDGRLQPPR